MSQHGTDELHLEIMRLGVDHKFPVKIGKVQIYLRPLSNSEMVDGHAAVSAHLERLPSAHRTKVMEDTLLAREFLKKASSPFGEYRPQLTDPYLDCMTVDQLMAVYKEWLSITDRINPQLEKIDPELLHELVDSLKKNKPEDILLPLTELSFGQLTSLVAYLLTKGD